MFMVAIFYIFLEHCVTCCSKIISCGKFSLNIWNRFFIRGIREQQFVLLYKLKFSKIHKLTLCVKKNSIWTLCMKFLSRSHVKRCFFLLQSVLEKNYVRASISGMHHHQSCYITIFTLGSFRVLPNSKRYIYFRN